MNLATREYTFFDPMSDAKRTNTNKDIVDRIISVKLNGKVEWKDTLIDHTTQNDCMCCGVFICYYAEQLALGSYSFFFYPNAFLIKIIIMSGKKAQIHLSLQSNID